MSLETSDLPVIFRQLCKTFSEKYNVSSVVNIFCLKEFFILLIWVQLMVHKIIIYLMQCHLQVGSKN